MPIRQKEVLRLDDQLCLFANIGSVLSLHLRFLGALKDRYANWYAPLLPHTPLLTATPHDTHPTLTRHRPSQPMLGDLFCKYIVRLARRQIGKAGWCSAHAFRSVSLSCQTQKLFHEEYAVYVLSYHASIELLHRLKASPTKTAFLSFVEVPNDSPPPEWRGLGHRCRCI